MTMRGRVMHIAWQEDEATLWQQYRHEREGELRPRWQALWLLRQGRRLGEVAPLVGVQYRTVQQWVAWYRHGGVAEVRRHRHGGRQGGPRRLTPEQEAALGAQAAQEGFATVGEVAAWVERQWGIRYTYWGMRHVVQRLGLKKKVPRPLAAKASLPEQEAWKGGASRTP
jgi:transposase